MRLILIAIDIILRYADLSSILQRYFGVIGINTERLRQLRKQHGLSQRELARRCNLSDSMIRKYEIGEHDPTGHALKLLAQQLKVSVDYLLGLSDDPESQIHESDLKTDERHIVEIYRREGWPGVIRLGAERIAK